MSQEKDSLGSLIMDSDSDVPIPEKEKSLFSSEMSPDIPSNPSKPINSDNDQDLIGKDQSLEGSRCQNCLNILSSSVLETLIFMYMFSYMIRSAVTSNMMMDKACLFRLNYSRDICGNLSNYTEEKAEVERIANNFGLYINLIHMGPGALVMIFLGPWSDKYGRKPPLMLTVVGSLLDAVGTTLNAYFFDAKLEYMLLSSVPSGVSGGFICFLTVAFSLASEITTKKRRTLKYMLVQLGMGLGMTCGSLAGGLIYKFTNSYVAVYCTSVGGHLICGLWVLLLITETKGLDSTANWKQKICDAFTFKMVVEGFMVCIKPRENHGRAQIWLLFMSACCIVLTYESFAQIGYTYVHHRYNWDPAMNSYVTTFSTSISMAVMVVCIPVFIRVFKLRDSTLGIIGTLSSMAKNICIGLALKPWIYYMGNAFGALFGLATLTTRSVLSKIAPEDELGKLFSFLSICEVLLPLGGTVLITKIFNATILTIPGLCYLIASALLVIPLAAFTWISRLKLNDHEIMKSKEADSQPVGGNAC